MAVRRRVALLIETSRGYGRGLVRGISRYNRERGRWSVYFQPHGLDDPPPPWLKHWEGDGILARIRDRRMARAILETGVPVVELRGIVKGLKMPLIGPDNFSVARLAVEHLLERGFRHFGFCGLPRGVHPYMDQRREHFTRLIEEAGCRCDVFKAKRDYGRGDAWDREQRHIAAWIDSLPKPVGVMACNDERGLPLLDACRRAEARVPDEVAVISVDNDEYLCDMAIPPLTSIDVNPEGIGYQAAAVLDRMMAGKPAPPEHTVVAPRGVVTRQSSDVLATDDRAVARAVAFIRDHARDRIHVADVLRHVNLSRAVLEPRLKKILGRTIYREIQRVQIEHVKRMLSTTELPLKQISHQAGFAYVQYMSRVFRRSTGMSPGEYRKGAIEK